MASKASATRTIRERIGISARGEAEGVPPAVEALVVVEDGLGDLGVEAIAGHGEAELGMALHELPLVLVEGAGLAEDARVEVDLAYIVKDSGEGQAVEIVVAEPDA